MQPIGGKKGIAICILKVLQDYSDFDHPLTQNDIIHILKNEYGIEVARNAVRRNISLLKEMGYDISTRDEDGKGTFLREREFDDMELRVLIDSVLSSKYIPENTAKILIDKLAGLSTIYFKKKLPHVAMISEWNHQRNQQFFWNLEVLTEAIEQRKQVLFTYNRINEEGELKPVRDDKYTVNPFALVCTSGQYYLIASHKHYENLIHYRIDRMTDIEQIAESARDVRELPGCKNGFDIAAYSAKHHLMFGGETERIVLKVRLSNASEIIDAFGRSAKMEKIDDEYMKVMVYSTRLGMRFFALQYADICEVLEPAALREDIKETIQKLGEMYGV